MIIGKSIRIYDLARLLKQDIKRVMEDLRREGVDVRVASNSISGDIAVKILNKYSPKTETAPKRAIKIIRAAKVAKDAPVEIAPKRAIKIIKVAKVVGDAPVETEVEHVEAPPVVEADAEAPVIEAPPFVPAEVDGDAPIKRQVKKLTKKEIAEPEVEIAPVAKVNSTQTTAVHKSLAQLSVGSVLQERYTIVGELGQGNFGYVYLAEWKTRSGPKYVALKSLNDPNLRRVLKEISTWKTASDHPNVVQFLAADEHNGRIFLLTEYIPDGSLEDWLQKNGGKSTVSLAVHIATGILAGLEHLHGKDILHNDLKPANILLKGFTPLITDFGLADDLNLTVSNLRKASEIYAPPEYFNNEKTTEQHDLWSTAILLFRLLTGRLPFLSVGQTLNQEPELMDVPEEFHGFFTRAFQKDPQKRFQVALEMSAAVSSAFQQFENFRKSTVDSSWLAQKSVVERTIDASSLADKPSSLEESQSSEKCPLETETISRRKYVIDGSNLCRWRKSSISLAIPLNVCAELAMKDQEFICFFDAKTRYDLPEHEKQSYKKLFDEMSNLFVEVTGGIQADEFILQKAEIEAAPIISNDRFRDFADFYSWVEDKQRLIKGTVADGYVQIPHLAIASKYSSDLSTLTQRLLNCVNRKVWDEIEAAYNSETPVTGRVVDKTLGGLRIDLNGVEAFLPGSQIDSRPIRSLDSYVGQDIEAQIIKFSRQLNSIILSRKLLTDLVVNEQKAETLSKIDVGYIVEGKITNLMEYGAFVDIGGIDGLLHVSDMSWDAWGLPNEYFKVGDHIQVKILKLDRDSERVSLGYKQLMPKPLKPANRW